MHAIPERQRKPNTYLNPLSYRSSCVLHLLWLDNNWMRSSSIYKSTHTFMQTPSSLSLSLIYISVLLQVTENVIKECIHIWSTVISWEISVLWKGLFINMVGKGYLHTQHVISINTTVCKQNVTPEITLVGVGGKHRKHHVGEVQTATVPHHNRGLVNTIYYTWTRDKAASSHVLLQNFFKAF